MTMKSYFEGNGIFGMKHHLIQYFDGHRIREVSVTTLDGKIHWSESTVCGILEPGLDYRTAKRRLASYEEKGTRRIG